MDTHEYKQIKQKAAKDLILVNETSNHPKTDYVKLLGVSVFHVDLNILTT